MDSFTFHNLQAEKANAILKYRQLRRVANLLWFVEVCVVLILISRFSIKLPVAVKNSSEYFRDFSVFMASPRFVFLIGNLIIITLFAQSGQFSAQGSRRNNSEPEDLYHEFIQNTTKTQIIQGDPKNYPEKQSLRTEDSIKSRRIDGDFTKYPDKQSMNSSTITDYSIKNQRIDGGQNIKTGDTNISVHSDEPRHELNRCETENGRKSIQPEKVERTCSYPEDDMSDEEFRRIVEAFIARQQRLQREEDYSVV